MQLIQVLYRNARGGPVDDITLDELIRSRKITHFYRPSEDRWVDIFVDPVRGRDHAPDSGRLKRRYADREEDNDRGARGGKFGRLFRGVFTRPAKHPPRKVVSAEEWLERGLTALRVTNDQVGAARAFALSIRVNPHYQEAYLHRGLAYEALGNFQQAIEDYGTAIELDPKNGKAHNPRGLVVGRPDVTVKAITGLRRAADLLRASSRTLLVSPTELREALEAFGERRRDAGTVGDEGTPRMAANLQRLIEKYTNEIEQFEGQLREVKRKHDILMEAARLVDEEALNPHKSFNE